MLEMKKKKKNKQTKGQNSFPYNNKNKLKNNRGNQIKYMEKKERARK